ncbi:11180_t:CDS:1, partial [Acaulospora morrowiae]
STREQERIFTNTIKEHKNGYITVPNTVIFDVHMISTLHAWKTKPGHYPTEIELVILPELRREDTIVG